MATETAVTSVGTLLISTRCSCITLRVRASVSVFVSSCPILMLFDAVIRSPSVAPSFSTISLVAVASVAEGSV